MGSDKDKLMDYVEEIIKREGAELVEFKVFLSGGKSTCRVITDYPEGGITISDCARINTMIFSFLKESQLLGEDFTVEVNSPGLKRSLKTYKDFLRVKGKNICLWLQEPYKGKEYLEGRVVDVKEEKLVFEYQYSREVKVKNSKHLSRKLLDREKEIYELNLDKIRLGKEKLTV
jgi:ribosome maturation factor RimP